MKHNLCPLSRTHTTATNNASTIHYYIIPTKATRIYSTNSKGIRIFRYLSTFVSKAYSRSRFDNPVRVAKIRSHGSFTRPDVEADNGAKPEIGGGNVFQQAVHGCCRPCGLNDIPYLFELCAHIAKFVPGSTRCNENDRWKRESNSANRSGTKRITFRHSQNGVL